MLCLQRILELYHGGPADFDHLWFSARALMEGRNPYPLVGPGREFDPGYYLCYPVTALVALLPLAILPLEVARMIFVAVSAALLCWGLTRTGWWRVAIFVSGPFFNATGLAQWSVLITASFLLPKLAGVVVAKPTAGFAVLSSLGSQRDQYVALAVSALIGAISLMMFPAWPLHWITSFQHAEHVVAPITHLAVGGPLVLLALLRWRRPEARFLTALVLIPQSTVISEALFFLMFPSTPRGILTFTIVSWIPYYAQGWINDRAMSTGEVHWKVGNLLILFFYLPALVMVLRRPNEGEVPRWLDVSVSFVRKHLAFTARGAAASK